MDHRSSTALCTWPNVYPQVCATVGIHPHDAAKATPQSFDELRALGQNPKVVAFGEIGLDYHYDFSPRELQRDVFIEQLKIARDLTFPLRFTPAKPGTTHWLFCRSTGKAPAFCTALLVTRSRPLRPSTMGYHLAFGGVLTFRTADSVREAAKITPDDRLLVETDAPYLAPLPWRGKRNEPSFMVETVRRLAEVRGVTPEHIASVTTANFERLCLRPRNSTRYTEVSHGN